MKGNMVQFDSQGQSYSGYYSPSRTGSGPAVIVIQEWWGLAGHIKDVTDRFAEEGFMALAPDFYHGSLTNEPDEAGSLMMALNIDDSAHVIHSAVSHLLSNKAITTKKVGVVGFCMGGQLALYAASIENRIGACVNYYGIHPNVKPDFKNLKCPVLGHFASEDPYTGPDVVKELSQSLETQNIRHDFKNYAGRQHAFFNSDRPEVYDHEAAEDSWQRTLQFFKDELS